jgi:hypothetical protein
LRTSPPRPRRVTWETWRFQQRFHAPPSFVYRWCTDFREDDDRITNDLYQYRAKILLREPDRTVRLVTTPGSDRNRNTDVEVITLVPPDRWKLTKYSFTDDETGRYRLRRLGPELTELEIVLRRRWKVRRRPNRERYRALFRRVWERYAERIEVAYRARRWTESTRSARR